MVVAMVLLFVGTFAAIVLIKGETRAETAQIVPLPQIGGGALHRGPWPGCLGIQGTECKTMIEEYAPDTVGFVEILTAGTEPVASFSTHRVKILVDEDGIVTKIPLRG